MALAHFHEARLAACTQSGRPDPSYWAGIGGTSLADRSLYQLTVTHDGASVLGAHVCLNARQLSGPAGPTVSDEAHEAGDGRYDLAATFQPPGHWTARVVVVIPGRRDAIVLPLKFSVVDTVRTDTSSTAPPEPPPNSTAISATASTPTHTPAKTVDSRHTIVNPIVAIAFLLVTAVATTYASRRRTPAETR